MLRVQTCWPSRRRSTSTTWPRRRRCPRSRATASLAPRRPRRVQATCTLSPRWRGLWPRFCPLSGRFFPPHFLPDFFYPIVTEHRRRRAGLAHFTQSIFIFYFTPPPWVSDNGDVKLPATSSPSFFLQRRADDWRFPALLDSCNGYSLIFFASRNSAIYNYIKLKLLFLILWQLLPK